MPTVSAKELTRFSSHLYQAAGAPPDIADYVAATLVRANLCGHDSHGVLRHGVYLQHVKSGGLHPARRPVVLKRTGAIAIVDCQRGFGQTGARFGVTLLREMAPKHGAAAVALANCNHIGRLGEYAGDLAQAGLVGLVLVGIPNDGLVAPWGGRQRVTGTNPMAWGVPTGAAPLVLDYATSIVAAGKMHVYSDRGEAIPEGWVIDDQGRPTQDPDALFAGGMLLPFGTYKGYALNLMMALIPVLLSGATPSGADGEDGENPTLMLALSIEAFQERARFERLADELRERAHAIRPTGGHEGVMLPGEPEERSLARRLREGIPLPQPAWNSLQSLAGEWGIAPLHES